MAMNVKIALYRWMPLIFVGIMITSSISLLGMESNKLIDENDGKSATARQSPEEQLTAECDGITFEEMFTYTHAIFDITINDDWKSADMWGFSWVMDHKLQK